MPPKHSAPSPQWPPRSPHEALIGTPSGRERFRRIAAERASVSPSASPSRRARAQSQPQSQLAARSGHMRGASVDVDMDDEVEEEEDDEEMLQLKLQAIEAKLKLKKLQKKQQQQGPRRNLVGSSSDAENTTGRSDSTAISDILVASRAQSRAAVLREGPKFRPQSQMEVQVPASPVRRAPPAQGQTSPSRVLLGIDKGLKAKDVSLKRASSLRRPQEAPEGGYLRRSHTPSLSSSSFSMGQDRPKSFSERLAAARTDEASRQEKQERIKRIRSKTFDVGQAEVEQYKSQATEIPDDDIEPETFSREEVLAGHGMKRSKSVPTIRKGTTQNDPEALSDEPAITGPARKKKVAPSEVPEDEATSFEPFSGTHLSKRILPHSVLTRAFAGKKTYVIKDLLACVKGPEFQLPEVEQDIVVFGILASKSEPRAHKPTTNPSLLEKKSRFAEDDERGKYMVLTLVDLQWQLELFLFNTAFQRYWKLTPGTLIAILNPTVMPPPKGREDTGRFSLVINSDGDTVLEIGTARDLGFCKSVKKDGNLCNSWVNKKRTEFCEFHMNSALDKHRLARQELNTGSGPGGPRDKKYREKYQRDKMDKYKSSNYDRSTHSHWFVSNASAASLLDGEQMLPGQVAERVERGDALRRRLAAEEKEREIMKQLSKTGRGAGKEYMGLGAQRTKLGSSMSSAAGGSSFTDDSSTQSQTSSQKSQQLNARSLGLVGTRGLGSKIHLSPIKRKRDNSASSITSSLAGPAGKFKTPTASGGLGWGAPLKDKLARMKEGEKLDGSTSGNNNNSSTSDTQKIKEKAEQQPPARKKTRFVTEKGIREAGRESLGIELDWAGLVSLDDDDDDDELVILK